MKTGQVMFAVADRRVFADGEPFEKRGVYERLGGKVHVRVDPASVPEGGIADLELAQRDQGGLIACTTDFMILKPVDLSRGNGRLFFDYGNRGNKRALQFFNDAVHSNEPLTCAHAGNGFLMRRGYAIVWVAWQADLLPGGGRMLLDVPVAENDGAAVTGTVRTEFIADRPSVTSFPLSARITTRSHTVASLDTGRARLTRRRYPGSEPVLIPPERWAFAREEAGIGLDNAGEERAVVPSASHIHVADGIEPGWIYELEYEGAAPLVLGLGHAVVRDAVAFLKSASSENPLLHEGRGARKAYAWGRSQTGRCIRDFIYHGFNADPRGGRVFDGVFAHVAGAGRMNMARFANLTVAGSQQYEDHGNETDTFPFAYGWSVDPLSGARDSIARRPDTDPLIIHTQTATEYWQRRGSLVHTDAAGNDLPDPANVRIYSWASSQHYADPRLGRPATGVLEHPTNVVQTSFLFRALLDALDRWATDGNPPPLSRVPRRADGTLVTAEAWRAAFPQIPGAITPRAPNGFDGPRAEAYAVLVPAVDPNGNEVAGIRAPMVAAPLATYTGWNIRPRGYGYGAMHGFDGATIAFPETAEDAAMTGDPRRAIIERYGSADGYVASIRAAAEQLIAEGFMLEDDLQPTLALARDWGRPRHDVSLPADQETT
jgi:Alpha/beta hydrolase domain